MVCRAAVVLVPGHEDRGGAGPVFGAREDRGQECRQPAVTRGHRAVVRVVAEVRRDEGEARRQVGRGAERDVACRAFRLDARVVRRRVVLDGVETAARRRAVGRHRLLQRAPVALHLGEDAGHGQRMRRGPGVVADPLRRAGGHGDVVGQAGMGLRAEVRRQPARGARLAVYGALAGSTAWP